MNPAIHKELVAVAKELRELLQTPDAKLDGAQKSYRLGCLLGSVNSWDAAAACMQLAGRLDPLDRAAGAGMAECGIRLFQNGVPSPQRRLPPERFDGKISVVICSITPLKLERMRAQFTRLLDGEPWELIHIDDAHSLSEGYDRGIDRASGEIVILCHDDIEIFCDDFAAKLRTYLFHCDLIGVAGATKLAGPMWSWAGAPYVWAWVGHPLEDNRSMALCWGLYGPLVVGAQTLDGLFFAARKSLFDRVRYDAETFDGFHFYDLDFSYRAALAGARCGIGLDITIFHESLGHYDTVFEKYAERFCQKFPEARPLSPTPNPSPLPLALPRRSDLKAMHAWCGEWAGQNNKMVIARINAGLNHLALAPRT